MTVRLLVAAIAAVTLAVTVLAPRGWAQEVEDPDVEVSDLLVTRTPMPEREVEIGVSYQKGREGRELETEVELSWRFGRQLSLELEVPIVYLTKEFDYRVIAVFNWEF